MSNPQTTPATPEHQQFERQQVIAAGLPEHELVALEQRFPGLNRGLLLDWIKKVLAGGVGGGQAGVGGNLVAIIKGIIAALGADTSAPTTQPTVQAKDKAHRTHAEP